MEIEKLPTEIAANIFSRLPFDSVWQCKCVSKYWCKLLKLFIHSSDLYFAKLHASHRLMDSSSSPPDSILLMLDQSVDINNQTCEEEDDSDQLHYVELYNEEGFNCKAMKKFNSPLKMDSKFWTMATSSNGLICSAHHQTDDYSYLLYVYNPFLGEYITLPNNSSAESSMAFGFGHIPSTDEYKVVRVVYPPCGDVGNVEVYTLGNKKSTHWTSKGNINYRLQCDSPGVLVNGSIHWLTEKDDEKQTIVAFDLLGEEFREVPLPLGLQANTNFKIKQLEGSLCGIDYVKEEREMIMWKFMEDYYIKNKEEDGKEKKEYWKSIFEIQWKGGPKGFEHCFCWKKVDQSLLWMSSSSSVVAVEHDVEGPKIDPKELKHARLFHGIPHIKSFVSLAALGENNTKTIKDVRKRKRDSDKDGMNKKRKTINLMKILFGRKPKKSKRAQQWKFRHSAHQWKFKEVFLCTLFHKYLISGSTCMHFERQRSYKRTLGNGCA